MVEDFLRGIKVSDIRPEKVGPVVKAGVDPLVYMRNRLIDSINTHKQLVQAEIDGKPLELMITKRVNGEEVTVPKRILKWYFKASGNWHTLIRYGTTSLKFEGGDAIQCGPELTDVIRIFDRIAKAAEAGKLDTHIAQAKIRSPRGSRQTGDEEEEVEEPVALPVGRQAFNRSARR